MQQVISCGYPYNYDNVNTTYTLLCPGGAFVFTTESAIIQSVVSAPGTISKLYFKLTAAPGAGKSVTFTVRKNGIDTSLSVTISGTDTTGSDLVNSIAVSAGDLLSVKCVPSGTPTASQPKWSIMFTGTNAKESNLFSGGYTSTSLTYYFHAFGGLTGEASGTEADAYQVIPTAGTLRDLYISLDVDPGTSPDAYSFTLRKNGVNQSLTVTITADNKTGNDVSNTVSVSPGDYIDIMCVPLNSPATACYVNLSMTFVADVDGESLILGGTYDDLSASATEYNALLTSVANDLWSATESANQDLGQVCVLRKLYVKLSGTAGSAKGYTFSVRKNSASPAGTLSVSITGASDTTGNDVSNSVSVANGDVLNLMVAPLSSPTVRDAYWGLVCYIAPPVSILSAPVCFDMAVV